MVSSTNRELGILFGFVAVFLVVFVVFFIANAISNKRGIKKEELRKQGLIDQGFGAQKHGHSHRTKGAVPPACSDDKKTTAPGVPEGVEGRDMAVNTTTSSDEIGREKI